MSPSRVDLTDYPAVELRRDTNNDCQVPVFPTLRDTPPDCENGVETENSPGHGRLHQLDTGHSGEGVVLVN